MKVLFIIDGLGSGGAGRQMSILAAGLHDRGYNIHGFIYRPEFNSNRFILDSRNIKIFSINKKFKYELNPILSIKNIIRKNKYDLIFSFLSTPNIYAQMMRVWFRGLPIVVSIRNAYPYGNIPVRRYIHEQFYRIATHITTNSNHQRILMEKYHPWMKSKISTIYNGIDLKLFRPLNRMKSNNKVIRLLVLAKIREVKNVLGLIHALKFFRHHYGDYISVDWAGKVLNNTNDISTYEKANLLIEKYNLGQLWNWLGEQDDIPSLISNYDALIMPSFNEGLPNAICEALACGKPVLASNVCDHPQIVHHGITGYLFDPNNPINIAEIIYKFSTLSMEKRINMGNEARLYAEYELSLEKYVDGYDNLFLRLYKKAE